MTLALVGVEWLAPGDGSAAATLRLTLPAWRSANEEYSAALFINEPDARSLQSYPHSSEIVLDRRPRAPLEIGNRGHSDVGRFR